ncbi:MAG: hypothetical protein KAY24_03535 [Candidatus Eisenbacteria sp.]|nr:hypothetical protein [Candidatus Eisenbacteria bacterium]
MDDVFWLVNSEATLRVVWIDDMFFPSPKVQKNFEPGEEMIGETQIRSALREELTEEDESAMAKTNQWRIREIAASCNKRSVGFGVANFELRAGRISELLRSEESTTLFLLDVRNAGAPGDEGDDYGIRFREQHEIPFTHMRFYTRKPDRLGKGLVRYAIFATRGTIDDELNGWILGLFYHEDPHIGSALRLYAMPWNESWPEKWFRGKYHCEDHPDHAQEVAGWLGMERGDANRDPFFTSAKSLMIWHPDDGEEEKDYRGERKLKGDKPPSHPPSYAIDGATLRAAMQKLEIRTTGIDEGRQYRFPVSPGLPFLLSLRLFAAEAKSDSPEIVWDCLRTGKGDAEIYRVAVKCAERDWGLRESYHRDTGRGHGMKTHLVNLTRATINLGSELDAEWKGLFDDTSDETRLPVVAPYIRPGWVHLFWTAVRT